MPMYEFECEACSGRFEDLVPPGTQTTECRLCGSGDTRRLLSTPGVPLKLVKTPGAARKQEAKNAKLHAATKDRFKEARRRAREAKKGGSSNPGDS